MKNISRCIIITTLTGLLVALFEGFIAKPSCGKPNAINNSQQTKPAIILAKDSLVYDEYVLRVESTCLMDSVSYEERRVFKPIIMKQRLVFLKNKRILNIVLNKSRKINQKVSNGNKIAMLSIVYANARVIKGKYKTAFAVGGYGGCNSCPETYDFFTLEGTRPYNNGSTGEWKRFLKRYGIDNYSRSDNEISIYPPELK